MDRPILKYLYNFFVKEDYRFHSLNSVFEELKEKYGGDGSFDDFAIYLRDVIHYHVGLDNIEVEGKYMDWGLTKKIDGVNLYLDMYSLPIKAKIRDNGVEIIEKALNNEQQQLLSKSVIITNKTSRILAWIAVVFAALTAFLTYKQYAKKDPIGQILKNIQTHINQNQPRKDTVFLINPTTTVLPVDSIP